MKHLVSLLVFLVALNAWSSDELGLVYKVRYEVLGVKKQTSNLCAPQKPLFEECKGVKTKITVGATLNGCTDNLIFSKLTKKLENGTLQIFAVGLAESDLYGIETKCFMANTVFETIEIDGEFNGEIEVINREIAQF